MAGPASFTTLPRELRQMIWLQAATVQIRIVVHYSRAKPQRSLPVWVAPIWHETDRVSYTVHLPGSLSRVSRESYHTLLYYFRPHDEYVTLPGWFNFERDDVSMCFETFLHAMRQPWAGELQRLTYRADGTDDAFGTATHDGPISPPNLPRSFGRLRLVTIDVRPCQTNLARYTISAHPCFVWQGNRVRHWTDTWMVSMLDFHDGHYGRFATFDMRVICTNAPKEEWLTRWNYVRVRNEVLAGKLRVAPHWLTAQDIKLLIRSGHLDDGPELDNPPLWLSRSIHRRDRQFFVA